MSPGQARRLATVLGLITIAGVVAALAASASATSVHGNGATVAVASDYPFPPWEYIGKGGKLTGFDVDITHAIGRVTNTTFAFKQQPFDGIIPGIQSGKYEVAVSSITDNPDREKVVAFVDYALSKGALLVPRGNPDHLGQPLTWCGKTIAIQSGTVATGNIASANKVCKSRNKPAISVKTYPTSSATQLAIKSGAAAANLNDGASLAYVAKTVDHGRAFSVVQYTAPWNAPALIGIAVSKDQPQLVQQIKAGLTKIIKSGEYRRIAAKYGLVPYMVKSARINGATH